MIGLLKYNVKSECYDSVKGDVRTRVSYVSPAMTSSLRLGTISIAFCPRLCSPPRRKRTPWEKGYRYSKQEAYNPVCRAPQILGEFQR